MTAEIRNGAAYNGAAREIQVEELDELAGIVNGSGTSVIEPDAANAGRELTEPVADYLRTFLSTRQVEIMEQAREGILASNSTEDRMWRKMVYGILRHPAVIGKLALLAGVKSLEETNEDSWMNSGNCKDDTRFVGLGRKPRKIKDELAEMCTNCPVYDQCFEHVTKATPRYGFWAGMQRSEGGVRGGYHDDGAPVSLEEKLAATGAKDS